ESAPTPVLKLASVLLKSDRQPNAEFAAPVVMLKRAWSPSAVLNPAKAASGAIGIDGTFSGIVGFGAAGSFAGAACVSCKNAKQASADRTVVNIIFRLFIFNFLSFFWPFLKYPCRAAYSRNTFGVAPHPRGEGDTITSHLWPFVDFLRGRCTKNSDDLSREN